MTRGQERLWSDEPLSFDGPTIVVARRLIGAYIIRTLRAAPSGGRGREQMAARIVETEAYLPVVDPACHAYRGPTRRNASEFARPGTSYVYFIYGNHHCLNVATEPPGVGAAVLIRAAEPVAGLEAMRRRRPGVADERLASGPGNLCRVLSVGLDDDGLDLAHGDLMIAAPRSPARRLMAGPRIGLSTAATWPLRFFDPDSASVSAHRRGRELAISENHLVDGRARAVV